MICSRRLYKGNSYGICLPLIDTGITTVKFYTRGDVIIEKEPAYTGDGMCFELLVEDLDILADGVLRYSCDGIDSNTGYVIVTPANYSGETLDDLLEDAYDSGYTAGQEDCSGGTCEGVYESGVTAGIEEQKAKLTAISITANGEYTREDGYSAVTVSIPQTGHTDQEMQDSWDSGYTSGVTDGYDSGYTGGYESGYTDGAESVDCTDYFNSGYTSGRTDGQEEGFEEGYQSGETHQKSLLSAVTLSENGDYTREDGWSAVTVAVPQTGQTINNQNAALNIDENSFLFLRDAVTNQYMYLFKSQDIRPDSGHTGLGEVTVGGQFEPTAAITQGENLQKAKLTTTAFTRNDTYTRADGWSSVEVNVPQTGHTDQELVDNWNSGYTSGHTDGFEEGYDSGFTDGAASVDCTDYFNSGYTSGKTDGEETQKAKLESSAFTENGTYTRPDGWSSVTVNVAQSGYTQQDLIANLQGDYFVIPPGTDHLRPYAFYCQCFSSITIPDSVLYIDNYAFYSNECLRNITIPDSVTGVGQNVFDRCKSLSSVTIGSGLTSLGRTMFGTCTALQNITIPGTVTYIADRVFQSCSGLTAMTFEGLNPPIIASTTGITASLGSTDYTFPIYVPCAAVEDYKTAFGTAYAPRIQCSGAPTPVTASSISISGPQGNMAPGDTGSTSVTVTPNDATTSLSYSSSDSTVATVDTAGTITAVGAGTCNICVTDSISNLTSCTQVTVTQPQPGTSQITNVYRTDDTNGDFVPTSAVGLCSAEFYSAITEMKIDGVSVTPSMTADFSGDVGVPGRRHHTVEFTLNTAFVPNLSFYGNTYLVNSVVSGSCTGIGNTVYWLCKNLGVDRSFGYSGLSLSPNIVLGESDFGYCQNLKEFTIPTATTTIPASLLYVCSGLTSVTIHSGATQIKTRAFQQCHGLLSIVLPEALTKIESYAFDYCDSLAEIRLLGTVPPTLGQEDVFGHTSDCPIYVPAVAVQDYKTAWPRYADRIQAIQ